LKKKAVTACFLFFLALLAAENFILAAEERILAGQVAPDGNGPLPVAGWTESVSPYYYRLAPDLAVIFYAGYDQKYLYLGFRVEDAFLTFNDDFSLDFQGSDHLRVRFYPGGETEPPVTLYLLPSSKIKEPLLNIQGAAWRQPSMNVHSFSTPGGYFLAVAIELANFQFSSRLREIPLQIMVNEVNKEGKVKTYSLFGSGPDDYGTLVLSR